MVVVIDPQVAGISGDMMLCALADLGADQKRMIDGVCKSASLLKGCRGIDSMRFERTRRESVLALGLHLKPDSSGDIRDMPDASHKPDHALSSSAHRHDTVPTRKGTEMIDAIRRSTELLGLSDAASQYACKCVQILVQSESNVHGVPADSVEFHEASDVDTLVDVVGTAIAFDDLKLFEERICCLPVCVGGGHVEFSHGIMSNPAGAILEIFRHSKLPVRGSDAGCELATPTGACMLAALRPEPVAFYPHMRIGSVGYGAGMADHAGFANVLKIVRGPEMHAACTPSSIMSVAATVPAGCTVEHVCILETNVDDVSGEILGGLVEKIMDAGAKDVTLCPAITKKNRPSHVIAVMCDKALSGQIAGMIIAETRTLGVRVSDSERLVVSRAHHSANVHIGNRQFNVRYKLHHNSAMITDNHAKTDTARVHDTGDDDNDDDNDNDHKDSRHNHLFVPVRFKIEYDDIKKISKDLGIPACDVEAKLYGQLENTVENNAKDESGRTNTGGNDAECCGDGNNNNNNNNNGRTGGP